MNGTGKSVSSSAVAVPRFEIVDKDGATLGPFGTMAEARTIAAHLLGDQDEDRTGRGWDIQAVGADR